MGQYLCFMFTIEAPYNSFKIRHAIKFFLHETGYDSTKLDIKIVGVDSSYFVEEFGENKAKDIWGCANAYIGESKKYQIRLKRSLLSANERLLVYVLFEELSHVFQYDRGDLNDCNKSTKYKDKYYKLDMKYEKCPWEIEAKAESAKITKKYFKYLKEKYGKAEMPTRDSFPVK